MSAASTWIALKRTPLAIRLYRMDHLRLLASAALAPRAPHHRGHVRFYIANQSIRIALPHSVARAVGAADRARILLARDTACAFASVH